MDQVFEAQTREAITRWEVETHAEINPPVTHREAVALMCSASALLLLSEQADAYDLVIYGKTFEYLRARRPILALNARGAQRELLEQMDSAEFAESEDSEAIYHILHGWLDLWRQGRWRLPSNPGYERFERRVLARRLAEVFNSVIGCEEP
jgi:hypothetical protein